MLGERNSKHYLSPAPVARTPKERQNLLKNGRDTLTVTGFRQRVSNITKRSEWTKEKGDMDSKLRLREVMCRHTYLKHHLSAPPAWQPQGVV
jgi:hypothetical protein